MANFLYPWARNAFLTGHAGWTPNWGSDTVNVMFINAGVGTNYTFSGTGATGYAWQPSLSESSAQAGYAITYISQVPMTHRTMAFSSGIANSFGGGAVTHNLLSKTTLGNGVADASDVVVYEVPSGSAVSAFVIYRYVGGATTAVSDASSHLIAFFDSAQGMPVLGNGGDITVVWSSGDTRIFKL